MADRLGRKDGGGLCCERYDDERLEAFGVASKCVVVVVVVVVISEALEVSAEESMRELESKSPAEESRALRRLSALPM